jgi:hypothetical protein
MLKLKKQDLHEKVLNYTFKKVRTSTDINAVLQQRKPSYKVPVVPLEDNYDHYLG